MKNVIPKIIHYCWFSDEKMPPFILECVATWKKIMPDYKLRLWDSSSFNFDSITFVKEAYESKKWAFVADYVRLHALFTEGGIYLDSDVKVFKRFDKYLTYNFFTSHEIFPSKFTDEERNKLGQDFRPKIIYDYIQGLNVQAAIMGAKKGNPFLKDCLEFYQDKHFINSNGESLSLNFLIGPIISKIAENYGYRYVDEEQILNDNMIICKSDIFVGMSEYLNSKSYALHLCNGSWREKSRFNNMLFNIRNNYPRIYPFVILLYKGLKKIQRNLSFIN